LDQISICQKHRKYAKGRRACELSLPSEGKRDPETNQSGQSRNFQTTEGAGSFIFKEEKGDRENVGRNDLPTSSSIGPEGSESTDGSHYVTVGREVSGKKSENSFLRTGKEGLTNQILITEGPQAVV